MVIKNREEIKDRGIEFDLSGPEGNAFNLLGWAKKLASDLGKDANAIMAEMQEGDYDNLVEVFEREFGDVVTIYREGG